jgi:hypothetical protein
MKTIEKKEKRFDSIKTFRKIKNKISKDMEDMSVQQIMYYLSNPTVSREEVLRKVY